MGNLFGDWEMCQNSTFGDLGGVGGVGGVGGFGAQNCPKFGTLRLEGPYPPLEKPPICLIISGTGVPKLTPHPPKSTVFGGTSHGAYV